MRMRMGSCQNEGITHRCSWLPFPQGQRQFKIQLKVMFVVSDLIVWNLGKQKMWQLCGILPALTKSTGPNNTCDTVCLRKNHDWYSGALVTSIPCLRL